ncbi:MAG: hypothetical protein ACKVOP_07025 [Sphingomonadaceae bacterium]
MAIAKQGSDAMNGFDATNTGRAALLWSAILGLTALVGSYAFACVFPFAAIAAVAALTLSRREAVAVVAATFAANQIVGFAFLGYPHEATTYAWGGVILIGAGAALIAATVIARLRKLPSLLQRPAALLGAIVAYQIAMFAGAWALDGFASSTPTIVAQVALNDALWFAGLFAVRVLLGRLWATRFGSLDLQTARG